MGAQHKLPPLRRTSSSHCLTCGKASPAAVTWKKAQPAPGSRSPSHPQGPSLHLHLQGITLFPLCFHSLQRESAASCTPGGGNARSARSEASCLSPALAFVQKESREETRVVSEMCFHSTSESSSLALMFLHLRAEMLWLLVTTSSRLVFAGSLSAPVHGAVPGLPTQQSRPRGFLQSSCPQSFPLFTMGIFIYIDQDQSRSSLLFKFTIHLPWDKFYPLKTCTE